MRMSEGMKEVVTNARLRGDKSLLTLRDHIYHPERPRQRRGEQLPDRRSVKKFSMCIIGVSRRETGARATRIGDEERSAQEPWGPTVGASIEHERSYRARQVCLFCGECVTFPRFLRHWSIPTPALSRQKCTDAWPSSYRQG